MKKILSAVVAIILIISSVAVAETDLSSMTYDDLIALQMEISLEIMSRPEWKEVNVPAGEYEVGVDIPAKKYKITSTAYMVGVGVYADARKNDSQYDYYIITDKDKSVVLNLLEGQILILTSEALFTPYVGLGF